MPPARMRWLTVGLIGGTLVLGGCAVVPPPAPSLMALPGQGKDQAAFQADDAACRASGAAYFQCMAARGDIVQQAAYSAGYAAYPGYALAGGYPAYPYDTYYDGLFGPYWGGYGWGGGWGGGWRGGDWRGGDWHGGGWGGERGGGGRGYGGGGRGYGGGGGGRR